MKSITKKRIIKLVLLILMPISHFTLAEESVDFNTDFLDDTNSQQTDFSKFAYANYITPGQYLLGIEVNKIKVASEDQITFFVPDYDDKDSIPCITPEMYSLLGLKSEWDKKITWLDDNRCLDIRTIPQMSSVGDLSSGMLKVSIPQAFMEYQDPSWDPPSRWDDGIAGLFIDYNATGRWTKDNRAGNNNGTETGITATGTIGANLGAWRVRSDWQAITGSMNDSDKSWSWNQLYMFRAIRSLSSKLMIGEQYLSSTLFDSFRYIGASLETDESMFPPRLHGYAPEVAGIARTNATVIVKQDGRIIYQTEVSPGPFRIQDINAFGGGTMDVSIEEQDGGVQTFKVETSSIGTLTRPGQFIYKLVAGKTSKDEHKTQGPAFGLGSFSWGATNNTTIYGGLLGSSEYQNIAFGLGRDMAPFGVLSANISISRARLGWNDNNETLTGNSYNITYSKQFDEINSQLTFAGYRFSEKNYMNMDQFIDRRYNGQSVDSGKELYSIIFGTAFPDMNMNMYLNYSHQTYWNRPTTDQYNITVSKYFDIGAMKNISINFSAYKIKSTSTDDNGVFVNLNVPLDKNNASIGYSGAYNKNSHSNSVNYYSRIDDRRNYNVSAGTWGNEKTNLSGGYSYNGDNVSMTTNGTYIQNNQTSLSTQIKGGATITSEGGAFHRIGGLGDSRILIDTNGIKDIPIKNGVTPVETNYFGKAIISNMSNYSRNNINIDIDNLPDRAEALQSTQYATLTEGAIGYRKFNVMEGDQILAIIRDSKNNPPPFGASIKNKDKIEVGMISDNGFVYLSGVLPKEKLNVIWDSSRCEVILPETIDSNLANTIILPCK